MKLMKKVSLVLFAVCTLLLCTVLCAANSSAASVVDSGKCGGNVRWTFYDDGLLVVSGQGNTTDWEYGAEVPWISHRSKITSAIIEEGVTSLGSNAFYGSNVVTVTLPDSLTYIGDGAFFMCYNLETVNMGSGVERIGYSAFYTAGSNVISPITFPETLQQVGNSAFLNIENVTILSRDTSFGAKVFAKNATVYGYSGSTVEAYTKGEDITFIPLDAPSLPNTSGSCGDNLTWNLAEDGSLNIEGTGETWIWDPYEMAPWHSMRDSITSVTLAEGITALNDMAFAQCKNLTSIVIPESVAFISENVFSYCSSLSEIVILNDSITILEDAFKYNDPNTFTLYGHEGSAAEAYAAQYGYRFAVIEDSVPLSGDISGDGLIDISDAVLLFQHSMVPDLYPLSCTGSTDFNKDGIVDISDAVILFKHSMLPDLYPLEQDGAYAEFFRYIINAFDYHGLTEFSSPEMATVTQIIDISIEWAADYYDIDFTPYRVYTSEWSYTDYIPISVMDTLIQRMWGIQVDYSLYAVYSPGEFGYDEDAQIFRYTTPGGRGHLAVNYLDSYTIKDNQITILVKCYNISFEKPEFGVEGEDWFMHDIYGDMGYLVFSQWKEIKATLKDGYIQFNSFTFK